MAVQLLSPLRLGSSSLFDRVLRDSTPRYVGLSVGRLVGRLVPFLSIQRFELFEPTAPAQMLW